MSSHGQKYRLFLLWFFMIVIAMGTLICYSFTMEVQGQLQGISAPLSLSPEDQTQVFKYFQPVALLTANLTGTHLPFWHLFFFFLFIDHCTLGFMTLCRDTAVFRPRHVTVIQTFKHSKV